jgi:hypothetical protein
MAREWRDIASEVTKEYNPERFLELIAELMEAIDKSLARPGTAGQCDPGKKSSAGSGAAEAAERGRGKPA